MENAIVGIYLDDKLEREIYTDEDGRASFEANIGDSYKIRAQKEGCSEDSREYTIPESPDELTLTLECEAALGPDETKICFNPEYAGRVSYSEIKDGVVNSSGNDCGSSAGGCGAVIRENYKYTFETNDYVSVREYTGEELLDKNPERDQCVSMVEKGDGAQEGGGTVVVKATEKETGEPATDIGIQLIDSHRETTITETKYTQDTEGMRGKVKFENLRIGREFKARALAGENSGQAISDSYAVITNTKVEISVPTDGDPDLEKTEIEVIGEGEGPLEGAIVNILDGEEIISEDLITGEDGRVVSTLEKGRDYRAVAFKPGYEEDTTEITGGESYVLTLTKIPEEELTDINLFIRSDPDETDPKGEGRYKIPGEGGASIRLMKDSETPVSTSRSTDQSGGVGIADVAEGSYCLRVEWENEIYNCLEETSFEFSVPMEDDEEGWWRFYLKPPRYDLTVNVTDGEGTGIENADVEVNWPSGNRETNFTYTKTDETNPLGISTFKDEDGIVYNDRISVTVTAEVMDEYSISRTRTERMEGDETLDFEIDMDEPDTGEVTVHAINEENESMEGVNIELVDPLDNQTVLNNIYGNKSARGETDNQGLVNFNRLEEEREFRIKSTAGENNYFTISEEKYEVPGTHKEIPFLVEQGVNTTVNVVNETDGTPIENATIKIDNGDISTTKTNEEGKSIISLRPGETYDITIYKPNYKETTGEIIGGEEKTFELEMIPEEERQDVSLEIYTEADSRWGNRNILVKETEVTLETSEGESLITKETDEGGEVSFEGLIEGENYNLDISWKEKQYNEEFTVGPPREAIVLSEPPFVSLAAKVSEEDGSAVSGETVKVIWPHDGELQEGEEEYTREGETRPSGWTDYLEEIVHGDWVKVQANWTDPETGATRTPYTITQVLKEYQEEKIVAGIGGLDNKVNLDRIEEWNLGDSETIDPDEEKLGISPKAYALVFTIDLEEPKGGWEDVSFVLHKSHYRMKTENSEIKDWDGWDYLETKKDLPGDEQKVIINITKEGGKYEHNGTKGQEFKLPIQMHPDLRRTDQRIDYEAKWNHENISMTSSGTQKIEISDGDGKEVNGFYVERKIRGDGDWEAPTNQEYVKGEEVETKYVITRTDDEEFNEEIKFNVTSDFGNFTEEPEITRIDRFEEESDETAEYVPGKSALTRSGIITIDYKDSPLEAGETSEIKLTTITDAVTYTTISGKAISEDTVTDLDNGEPITYYTEGNIPISMDTSYLGELEDKLILEINRKDKAEEKPLSEDIIKDAKYDSKITGEGLTCDEIDFYEWRDKIDYREGEIEIELTGDCHFKQGKIDIKISGGGIDEKEKTFDIKRSVGFPTSEEGNRIMTVPEHEERCPIPLNKHIGKLYPEVADAEEAISPGFELLFGGDINIEETEVNFPIDGYAYEEAETGWVGWENIPRTHADIDNYCYRQGYMGAPVENAIYIEEKDERWTWTVRDDQVEKLENKGEGPAMTSVKCIGEDSVRPRDLICNSTQQSGINIPTSGENIEVFIKNVKGPDTGIIVEHDEESMSFKADSGYEVAEDEAAIKRDIKIKLVARNKENEDIVREKELKIEALVHYFFLDDVAFQPLYTRPLEKYPEEGISNADTPDCHSSYCNLDQAMEYIIEGARETEEEEIIDFPVMLTALDNTIPFTDIESTLIQMGEGGYSDYSIDEWGVDDGRELDEGEILQAARDEGVDTYIFFDNSKPLRPGRNDVTVTNIELGEEEVTLYHIKFKPEDRITKYHYPRNYRLHIPLQRSAKDGLEEFTRTPVYVDGSMEAHLEEVSDITDDADEAIDRLRDRVVSTLEEAWDEELREEEIQPSRDEFYDYDHGIRIGICPDDLEDDITEPDALENCEKLEAHTGDRSEPAIFKEDSEENRDKINIIAKNYDELDKLIHNFRRAFGRGQLTLQVRKPETYGTAGGYLTNVPERTYYYAWDETADSDEEAVNWLEDEDDVLDEMKQAVEEEMDASDVEYGDINVGHETSLRPGIWVSWIIMRCENDNLHECGPRKSTFELTHFKQTFSPYAVIPSKGIFYTPETIETPEEEAVISPYGGTNIILVPEDAGIEEVKNQIIEYKRALEDGKIG